MAPLRKIKGICSVLIVLCLLSSLSYASTAPPAEMTEKELLKEIILLPIDCHAIYMKGVTAIYFGERSVTACLREGSVYVPLRFVAEKMGGTVTWNQRTKTASVTNGEDTVKISVGKKFYRLNGEKISLDNPARLTPSEGSFARTLVPLSFVEEALQYPVQWDAENQVVILCRGAHVWDPSGDLEKQTVMNGLAQISMFKMFI